MGVTLEFILADLPDYQKSPHVIAQYSILPSTHYFDSPGITNAGKPLLLLSTRFAPVFDGFDGTFAIVAFLADFGGSVASPK